MIAKTASVGDRRLKSRRGEKLDLSYSALQGAWGGLIFEEAETVDISQSGMRIASEEEFDTDRLLHVRLRLPALREPVLMLGKVCWAETGDKGFDVGVKFVGELPGDIHSYLAQHHSRQGPVA